MDGNTRKGKRLGKRKAAKISLQKSWQKIKVTMGKRMINSPKGNAS